MDLLKYNFICHECEKEFYTYINRIKYQEFINRQKDIREVFNNYPIGYNSLFVHGLCTECQQKNFNMDIEPYCLTLNAKDTEDSALFNKILELN